MSSGAGSAASASAWCAVFSSTSESASLAQRAPLPARTTQGVGEQPRVGLSQLGDGHSVATTEVDTARPAIQARQALLCSDVVWSHVDDAAEHAYRELTVAAPRGEVRACGERIRIERLFAYPTLDQARCATQIGAGGVQGIGIF